MNLSYKYRYLLLSVLLSLIALYLLLRNIDTQSNSLKSGKKIHIITSNNPIAAITKALTQDLANVESLSSGNSLGCTGEYQYKPESLAKIHNADFLIYIDDRFETYVKKIVEGSNTCVIKLSSAENLRIIVDNKKLNWHIWLDFNNIKIISATIVKNLARQFPQYGNELIQNHQLMIKKIDELLLRKQSVFSVIKGRTMLFENSTEYFFSDSDYGFNLLKINDKCTDHLTLSDLSKMNDLIKTEQALIILDMTSYLSKIINKLQPTSPIILIDSEQWNSHNGEIEKDFLFLKLYEIINKIG